MAGQTPWHTASLIFDTIARQIEPSQTGAGMKKGNGSIPFPLEYVRQ
jgi:hypothetical protein